MGKAKQKHHSPKARTSNIKPVAYSGENQFSKRKQQYLGIPITKSWIAPKPLDNSTSSNNKSRKRRLSKVDIRRKVKQEKLEKIERAIHQAYIDDVMNVKCESRVNPVKLTNKQKKNIVHYGL